MTTNHTSPSQVFSGTLGDVKKEYTRGTDIVQLFLDFFYSREERQAKDLQIKREIK